MSQNDNNYRHKEADKNKQTRQDHIDRNIGVVIRLRPLDREVSVVHNSRVAVELILKLTVAHAFICLIDLQQTEIRAALSVGHCNSVPVERGIVIIAYKNNL